MSDKKLDFFSFTDQIWRQRPIVMYLKIFVSSSDEELKKMYVEAAEKHNTKILEDPYFYDSGFDLFLPKDDNNPEKRTFSKANGANKVDFQVKCWAQITNDKNVFLSNTPFYTYARSSISKTPLRLANNQGIIDAGYRGNLIGMFDCLNDEWSTENYTRLLQICAPGLVPIFVEIVPEVEYLGPSTSRGEGGIGSTGK